MRVGAPIKFFNSDTDVQRAIIEVADRPRQMTLRWEIEPDFPGGSLLNTFPKLGDVASKWPRLRPWSAQERDGAGAL